MLHHVLLACPAGSEERSREFYGGLLGLAEVAKPAVLAARGGCWFRGPGIEIHLGVEPDFRPARKAHPALQLGDLDELRVRLAEHDPTPIDDIELPGYRRFYAADPHGNRLEFIEPLPESWELAGGARMRRARAGDVPAIAGLLRDDHLGATREGAAVDAYASAFREIDSDRNQLLAVLEHGGNIVGTCQLTFTRGMSRGGALRMTIEAVRVAAAGRGSGLGEAMIGWAIERARGRGAAIVQLTTDKTRVDAHRFYARFGFAATHEGMKLALVSAQLPDQPGPPGPAVT